MIGTTILFFQKIIVLISISLLFHVSNNFLNEKLSLGYFSSSCSLRVLNRYFKKYMYTCSLVFIYVYGENMFYSIFEFVRMFFKRKFSCDFHSHVQNSSKIVQMI